MECHLLNAIKKHKFSRRLLIKCNKENLTPHFYVIHDGFKYELTNKKSVSELKRIIKNPPHIKIINNDDEFDYLTN